MMLIDEIRDLVTSSKNRLDFDQVVEKANDLVGAVFRDGSIDDITKRRAVAALRTAIDMATTRRDSPEQFIEALHSVRNVAHSLEEPLLELLTKWFFHIAYRGHMISDDDLAIARQIVARKQPNLEVNERELRQALDRYEWLATYGPNPELTKNNAQGAMVSTVVRPLPDQTAGALRDRAAAIFRTASGRSKLAPSLLIREALDHCRQILSDAIRANEADATKFLPQTPTWCVRVALSSVVEIVELNSDLSDLPDEEIEQLRAAIDRVGHRSSSAVFNGFKQRFDSFRQYLQQSIDFRALRKHLETLRSEVTSARRGRVGVDQLSAYHANEAVTIISDLAASVEERHANASEVAARVRQIDEQIASLEVSHRVLTNSTVRRLGTDLSPDALLPTWIREFTDREVAALEADKLNQFRERMLALSERAREQEPLREAEFHKECERFARSLETASALPPLRSELFDLRRSAEEFSLPAQARLRGQLDAAFQAFRERVHRTDLLRAYLNEVMADVDRSHKRIRGIIDFEELYARAEMGKRWVQLRDFPEADRVECLRLVKRCTGEIHRLRARLEKVLAQRRARAAEVFEELKTDIEEVIADARARPGRQELWEELGLLDHRLRDARKSISESQADALREILDRGFQQIKDARVAFAVASAQRFAYYNDVLGDVLSTLEETPTRDCGFEAIDHLKRLRTELKEEKGLLRGHRTEIGSLLSQASQAVDEVFEKASSNSKANTSRMRAELERLEKKSNEATTWEMAFTLIANHKLLASALREAELSISDRRDLRIALDSAWEDIAEKLQQFRFSRTVETADATIKRLEQQGWLVLVTDVPRGV